jgi:hypothetical protein
MSDQTITTDVVEALLRASAHIKRRAFKMQADPENYGLRINEWVEAIAS